MKINFESLIFLQGVFEGIFLISDRTVTAIAFENPQGDIIDNFLTYFDIEKENLIAQEIVNFYALENEIKEFLQQTISFRKATDYEKTAYDIMDYIEFALNFVEDHYNFPLLETTKLAVKQEYEPYFSKHFLVNDGTSNQFFVINFF